MTALVSSFYEGLQRDPGQGSGCTLCESPSKAQDAHTVRSLARLRMHTLCEIPSKAQGAHCESPGVSFPCLKVKEFELILLTQSC